MEKKQQQATKPTRPQIKKVLKAKSAVNNNMCAYMAGRPIC